MTQRPVQPEPFLRGAAYPVVRRRALPPGQSERHRPTARRHLARRHRPAGVRLELVGDAEAIDMAYRTTGNLGYRGDGAGISFSVWRGGRKVCEEEAVLGRRDGPPVARANAPTSPPPSTCPRGCSRSCVPHRREGRDRPGPGRGPGGSPTGTRSPRDGSPRARPRVGPPSPPARPASTWSTWAMPPPGGGSWSRPSTSPGCRRHHHHRLRSQLLDPHTRTVSGMVAEGFHGFLDVVRQGHPTAPIVVISPIVRPDAETATNRLGATLGNIRQRHRVGDPGPHRAGDGALSLVAGGDVLNADHLADGIHPGDEGHKRLAAAVAKALPCGHGPCGPRAVWRGRRRPSTATAAPAAIDGDHRAVGPRGPSATTHPRPAHHDPTRWGRRRRRR